MATKKEKKLEHIQVKDNGIKLSQDIGDKLADAKTLLENEIIDGLLKSSNETNLSRYRIAQNVNLRNYQYLSDKVISKVKKDVKTSLKDDNTVNLTNKQVVNMSSQINKGLLFLQNSAVKTYQDTLTNILLRCKSAGDLKEQLQKHIDSGVDVGVIYKDGKNYQFDTYWEMKARTDIQNDIGSNMVKTGQENGVIFYIAAYFGDCAKDHVEYQGKIYVDKNWESNAPKDRLEEIRSYINSHDVKTVQEVMEPPARFTTRPNCRHYFQYIDIDSVLGAKNNDDVNKLRDERNLNFNGKYKPEKYEALQKQRLNERKIRAEKKAIDKLEHELALKPGDKNIQSQIKIGEANVRRYQAEQRDLIKQYNNLERRYDREALGNRANLGTNKTVPNQADLTLNENKVKILIEETYKTETLERLEKTDIEYNEVKELKQSLSEQEIIAKISGGDLTSGSCSSCAFAYIANKNGLDVLDFRGGKSREYFSRDYNILEIAKMGEYKIAKNANDFKAVTELLKDLPANVEYYLGTGRHAAIVRKNDNGVWQYLELQSRTDNGFKNLSTNVLKTRFKCQKSHSSYGFNYETQSYVIRADSLKPTNEFKRTLGYLNTKVENQKKGENGYEK